MTNSAAATVIAQALVTARGRGRAFSVGIAELVPGETAGEFLSRADLELYRGRSARGRLAS